MIIENGYISRLQQESSFDEFGIPIVTKSKEECRIPCNQHRVSGAKSKDGESYFDTATYEVIIDDTSFNANSIIIYSKRSKLGTFKVESIEYLDIMDALKITATRYAD